MPWQRLLAMNVSSQEQHPEYNSYTRPGRPGVTFFHIHSSINCLKFSSLFIRPLRWKRGLSENLYRTFSAMTGSVVNMQTEWCAHWVGFLAWVRFRWLSTILGLNVRPWTANQKLTKWEVERNSTEWCKSRFEGFLFLPMGRPTITESRIT